MKTLKSHLPFHSLWKNLLLSKYVEIITFLKRIHQIMCRWINYLQIKLKSANQFLINKSKNCLISRSKNDLQIEKVSTDWRTFSRLKNLEIEKVFDLQIEEAFVQIKELSPDQRTVCRSKNYLQIELRFTGNSSVCT